MFYRFLFFKIYTFLERIKSADTYDAAVGLMSTVSSFALFKIYTIFTRFIFHIEVEKADIIILVVVLFFTVLLTSHYILMRKSRHLLIEDFFKNKEYPSYYGRLALGLVVVIAALFVI